MARHLLAVVALVAASVIGNAAPAHAAGSQAVEVIGSSGRLVSFDGSISGIAALRSVASVVTKPYSGLGEAVCTIDGVGNDQNDCLGESSGKFWSYWRKPPGSNSWQQSGAGASSTTLSDGWMDGWAF